MQDQNYVPLIVDLDGTLTLTDTLAESVVNVVKQNPLNIIRLPFWLLKGRLAFKQAIAARANLAVEHLPYREALIDYLAAERKRGRKIVLATAAHRSIAERVSAHVGLFDVVIATESDANLRGLAKLEKIRACVGKQFVYAGDSRHDLPIWLAAKAAILTGVSPRLAGLVRNKVPIEREFSNSSATLSLWSKALRAHQWLKNLLLFVPLLTAFSFFYVEKLASLAMCFVSMSLGASATYIGNDIWDLESDRRHPRKRQRPFASGALSLFKGVLCATTLLAVSLVLAFATSSAFGAMLVLYLIATTAYSLVLKTRVIVDVIMLSLLYTLRILAGSVAVNISISHWLLAFSVFAFLSLALVKRCAELMSLRTIYEGAMVGRDYRVADLEVLWPLGIGSSLAAVIVFGLFINAPETALRYATPSLLWFAAIGLISLFARLWITTVRGEMHDDPIVHLIEDRGSLLVILLMVATMMAAHCVRF
ncbi:UbiA family prenyltransferase [Paraburkholderia sp. MMS20-SJTR3]|uniref:UbiA family prenyltransferase n=1 Tax=Paraburkholderia sejongensis TaxID=2886946 RepID=A0ABS8K6K1_9BURK|nr:UbiA family prenyltransferase [Paraburkholderia sp. MMS20-SJTR3]MCC8397498.1 UbiA family prenyltransferase [Paraburkholderia sp. MMS20-SJTR3]